MNQRALIKGIALINTVGVAILCYTIPVVGIGVVIGIVFSYNIYLATQ